MINNIKKSYLPIILSGIFAIQLITLFLTALFRISTSAILFIDLLLPVLFFVLFMTFKKDFKKSSKYMMNLLKLSIPIGVSSLITNIFFVVVGTKIPTEYVLLIPVVMVIALYVITMLDKPKELMNNIEQKDLKELFFNAKNRKSGDAKLGVDQKTKQPVILPLKDRYLHMLILGPTGSGKTSRIILPMIYDDVINENLGVIVLEPKGDLAEKVYAMAKLTGREVTYFNPMMKNCPYFNPLVGEEDMVIENLVTTFKMLDNGTKTFFQDNNENLIRRSVKVIKRLYGDKATLSQLETLILNTSGQGSEMISELKRANRVDKWTPAMIKENNDIASWFEDDYFTGATGQRGGTKTYENTSGVRNQLSKLNANSYLRRVLNPPADIELTPENHIDFVKCLAEGSIITMCSAQGSLRDLGKFLGYFLILQLQTATLSRPGNEDTRRGCMLYIDEFQTYANSGFSVMLEQGRSYRVASHLATQTRAAIGMGSGNMGKDFIQIVSANCRNVVIFHDINVDDALYYSKAFGQEMKTEEQVGYSRQRGLLRRVLNYTGENETMRYTEKLQARFTDSDIMYGPADEIIYKIIINMNVQIPGRSKVSWLPWDFTQKINEVVEKYNEENVINKNDYNPKVIEIGFEETNKYQGVSEIDETVTFANDLMGYKDESLREPEAPKLQASNISGGLAGIQAISGIKSPGVSSTTSTSQVTVEEDDA